MVVPASLRQLTKPAASGSSTETSAVLRAKNPGTALVYSCANSLVVSHSRNFLAASGSLALALSAMPWSMWSVIWSLLSAVGLNGANTPMSNDALFSKPEISHEPPGKMADRPSWNSAWVSEYFTAAGSGAMYGTIFWMTLRGSTNCGSVSFAVPAMIAWRPSSPP